MRIALYFYILFSLSACSLPTIKGLEEVSSDKEIVRNPYFSNVKKDYIYKAKIKALKHTFGGIVIIKRVGKEEHRIVFTTEFGNKIFDFVLERGVFKTNFIIEALDRPLIIKPLQQDFKTLIQRESVVLKAYTNLEKSLYQCKSNKKFNFYEFRSNTLLQIIQTSKSKEKIIFSFDDIKRDEARKIQIQHQNIQLQIDLIAF